MKALDGIADAVAGVVQRVTAPDELKSLLSGTFLGHALHPVLTDLPVGFWTSAVLLDIVGGDDDAVDVLLAAGNVSALATAATGLADWSDSYGPPRRAGLVHAALNGGALLAFSTALAVRRAGARRTGTGIALAGSAFATLSAYLGGDLVYHRGLGVDHSGFESDSAVGTWTDAAADTEVSATPRRVVVKDVPIMLVRDGDEVRALVATCVHAGGPLDEGQVADGMVTCPWHGSRFSLKDGSVSRGPAALPQPALQTRRRKGRIEVRSA
ncbi:MAG: Rieske 2Fe-2S domain-containing protein [Candidatus Dormibacteraeota bacterium]|nr:Rieske 2Fe-2S domain-containing protein [Candidatus Dormibacteraeota bacterium]